MIYGIIPVGGIGSRLGLPYPKELLPLKGYESYYPVCKLTVDKMLDAGCEKIYFIHGSTTKEQIKKYFNHDNFYHVNNLSPEFSKTITCFLENVELQKNDIILYGLPDSYYEGNLFPKMLTMSGLICGLFKTFNTSKVDRINIHSKLFDVKSEKNNNNSDLFWGGLKFDYDSILMYKKILETIEETELGNIVNKIPFQTITENKNYIDLGTWKSLNEYWSKN
jgi:hypothetical protein